MFAIKVTVPKEPRLHKRIRKMLKRHGLLQMKRDPFTGRRTKKHRRSRVR